MSLAGESDSRITGRLRHRPPGRAIVDLAEELRRRREVTIVVGHGGSSKASLLLGSTANYVVHHTRCPVVVVRGELRLPVRRVVVGVDEEGDDEHPDDRSLAALRWALRLPGVERIEVSHADFVPAVAAGPVREPGLESEEAVAEDDVLLRARHRAGHRRHRRATERGPDRARRRRRHRCLRPHRGVARRPTSSSSAPAAAAASSS